MNTHTQRSGTMLCASWTETIFVRSSISAAKKISVSICVHLWLVFWLASAAVAQVRPVNDYGALGLGQLLRKLQTTGSVMMVGAHPDDEDSGLLAYLARGENARTAYLSLTRGDGGQNIIGPELFEPLGVIRTEELLQARRLDGAEQYFTRAFDYGFSKTLAEAKSKWPEDVIKCDVVRAIRLFRPLVVISRFTGTAQDGHGQHQYAGYITPIAVKAAADWNECPGAGEPWRVKKFYIESGFNDRSEPTLRINTGQFDPILGRTYFEIAMEGRSLHRSQGEGRVEFHGDVFSGLNLAAAPSGSKEKGIFDGLDVTIGGIPSLDDNSEGPFAAKVSVLAEKVADVTRTADLMHPEKSLAGLAQVYKLALDAEWATRRPDSKLYLRIIQGYAVAALEKAGGIQIDALSDRETLTRGESAAIAVNTFFPGTNAQLKEVRLEETCRGVDWGGCGAISVREGTPPLANNARREAARDSHYFTAVANNTHEYLTAPYWLRVPRYGDVFSWPKGIFRQEEDTFPFSPPVLVANVKLEIAGVEVTFRKPVQFRFADPARGEIRREINVVPDVSVAVDRDLIIAPISTKTQTRHLVVSVTNNSATPQAGNVALSVGATPEVRVSSPQGTAFDLKTRGAKASIPIDVTIPRATLPVEIPIRATAEIGQAKYTLTMNTVAYPHIQTHRYYTPADSLLKLVDLKTSVLNIGYIMGSGDEVPEAIRQMGMKVTLLEEQDLASGDLTKFDTIVVGIRASETRPDLVANNQRLLDYAKSGGNVVMLYQRFNWTGVAPFPVNTQDKQGTTAGSINRVVDENAPVKILDPGDPVFNTPNKITEKDFDGWVQERNAYNLVTFDPQYKPLLESHDAGEQENKGGLVRAQLGKGSWTYCSYSFFRQLPAGVPGAYRLFANLLSLPKGK